MMGGGHQFVEYHFEATSLESRLSPSVSRSDTGVSRFMVDVVATCQSQANHAPVLLSILIQIGSSFTKWTSCHIEEDLKLATETINLKENHWLR